MSAGEILIILVIYLLLFGAKGVPSLAQTLGKAVYQFRNATKDVQDEILKSAGDIRREANSMRLDQMGMDDAPRVRTSPPKPVTNEEEEKEKNLSSESSATPVENGKDN